MDKQPKFLSRAIKFLKIWIVGALIYTVFAVITQTPPLEAATNVAEATVLGFMAGAAFEFVNAA